ncbi:hypothetical protein I4U23_020940 [Adineta vaga]|nr:hypothetical protein I4U23_020940 [Adineta vaga]
MSHTTYLFTHATGLLPNQAPIEQVSSNALPRSVKTEFPELVGESVKNVVAYFTARGLKPVLVQRNQHMIKDYRPNYVRIVTDPSGRVVIDTPRIGWL